LQLFWSVTGYPSETNLFRANNGLFGSGYAPDGVHALKFKGNSALLLGTNAANAEMGVMVYDLECGMFGAQPSVELVAINRANGQVLGTLIQFGEPTSIYAGDRKVIFYARGQGGSAVAGADVDALITVSYEPCTGMNSTTRPTGVTIEPLGLLKPTGTPAFSAPITPDRGSILFFSDAANAPVLEVVVGGEATEPSSSCRISVSPSSVNFGTVAVGSNQTQTLAIRNNGLISCTVTSLTRNGSSAFTVNGPAIPFAVPPGITTFVGVTFTPVADGADSAVLRISSTDPEAPQRFVGLSGSGSSMPPCEINVSPLALNFGSVEVGTNRTLQLTVANSGGMTCTVDNITLVTTSTDFGVASPTLPFTVAPGTSEVVSVVYTPSDTSGDRGTLEFNTDDPNNRLILISLNATGVTASCALEIGPTTLDFGAVVVGTNRTASVAITNHSLAVCTVNSITPSGSGDFALDPGVTTPFTVNPEETTNIVFVFTPTGGPVTNNFTLNSGSPSRDTNLRLTGIGVEVSSNCSFLISRTLLDFGDLAVDSAEIQKFQISNTGLTNCTIQNLVLTAGADFTLIAPPVPIDVPALAKVEIGVRFRPTTVGLQTGLLQILNNDLSQAILPVDLIGVGVRAQVALTATNLNFGELPVGTERLLSVWLENTNTVNATIDLISRSGSGDFALDPIVPTSRFILQAGEQVEIPVLYIPSNQGDDSGNVTISGNFDGSPASIDLNGVGLRSQLAVSPSSLGFGAVPLGLTNTLTVTLSNSGNTNTVVQEIEALGSGLFRVTEPSLPFTVEPDNPITVAIEYLPVNVETIVISGGSVKSSGNPTVIP
jgi:hypothetical protein